MAEKSKKRFQSEVVYQIYVRSFYDSNGDGYGDLPGVIAKLPYLASLGVGYIWLNPIFPSPQYDNGYDVSDYRDIHPMFGTMSDFEKLVSEAEKRKIGVILDMVFNHSSTEHAWFQKALAGDPAYLDYYYFLPAKKDGSPPTNWISKFGGSAWEKLPDSNEYYLHLFHKKQADLNWKNPRVREELHEILRFWISKGVQGFRFDVINLISKPEIFEDDPRGDGRGLYTDGPDVELYLRELHRVIADANNGEDELLTVGELSSTSAEKCFRYSGADTDELSMIFHFQHLKVDYPGNGEKWAIRGTDFNQLRDLLHTWQVDMCRHNAWDALFWNNHDQPRALTRFASDKREHHYRSATMLAATIHMMRGTPYIYQGEEIGMTNPGFERIEYYRDVETLNYYRILREQGLSEEEVMRVIKARSRDNSRTPMQWTDGPHAGFTGGTPWINAAKNKDTVNVDAEERRKDGILAFYRNLVRLRREHDIIQAGDYTPILKRLDRVVAFRRENELQYLLCINNFSDRTVEFSPDTLKEYALLQAEVLLSNCGRESVCLAGAWTLEPYETLSVLLRK